MDLNILYDEDADNLAKKVHLGIQLGYTKIAVNNFIDDLEKYHSSKKKKTKAKQITAPNKIKLDEQKIEAIKHELGVKKEFTQLSRITFVLEEVDHTNKIQKDAVVRSYDLIAVRPTTEKLFKIACSSLDIDILSFDLTQRLPFSLHKQKNLLGVAIERGMMLEIEYAPMIRDSSVRRNIISNALSMVEVCKGKNIIITSGCEKPLEIRAPFDVHNLAILFGLREEQAKNSNTLMCEKCITHGETAGKRISKCFVTITKMEDDNNSDEQGNQNPDETVDQLHDNALHTNPKTGKLKQKREDTVTEDSSMEPAIKKSKLQKGKT